MVSPMRTKSRSGDRTKEHVEYYGYVRDRDPRTPDEYLVDFMVDVWTGASFATWLDWPESHRDGYAHELCKLHGIAYRGLEWFTALAHQAQAAIAMLERM